MSNGNGSGNPNVSTPHLSVSPNSAAAAAIVCSTASLSLQHDAVIGGAFHGSNTGKVLHLCFLIAKKSYDSDYRVRERTINLECE